MPTCSAALLPGSGRGGACCRSRRTARRRQTDVRTCGKTAAEQHSEILICLPLLLEHQELPGSRSPELAWEFQVVQPARRGMVLLDSALKRSEPSCFAHFQAARCARGFP